MAKDILMPLLSPSMTEGTVIKWIKKEGDAVKSGEVIAEVPNSDQPRDNLGQPAALLPDLLVAAGLSPSKSQARKDVEAGGVYINNIRAADAKLVLGTEHLLFGTYVLLRKGKRNYALLRFR